MTTTVAMQSEYRNLPIPNLTESPANPRRTFDETALNELAESIRSQGVLSPLYSRGNDGRGRRGDVLNPGGQCIRPVWRTLRRANRCFAPWV
jgi:hypothetical protein